MKKSAFYSDILFTFTLTGVFTLCFFRYLRIAVLPALILAVLCGVLASTANGALLQSKRKTFLLKKSDEAQKQKLALHLALLSDERKTVFFEKALSAQTPAKRISRLRVATDEELYFLLFRFAPVTADDISAVYRYKSSKRKVVYCNEADASAVRLCERLQIRICDIHAIYAQVKVAQALPSEYLGDETGVNRRARRRNLCFAKSNSRRFLLAGALVLLSSLITPFPRYYLLFGSALLLLSIILRIFGKPREMKHPDTR